MAEGALPLLNSGRTLIEWYGPKMLTRFGDAADFKALMDGVAASRDEIMQASKEVQEGWSVVDAIGVQLDIIGFKFGLVREGLDDDAFRARILALGSLKLSGTSNQIIFLLKLMGYGTVGVAGGNIIMHPLWVGGAEPAAYAVVLEDPQNKGPLITSDLEDISVAGVGAFQGWFMLQEGETDEYILLEDAIEVSPGEYEGTPLLVY